MPITKGLPGPGLLTHLIVSKYTDHLPLHRLERVYERQGVFLHRSTLSDWLVAYSDLRRPLYDLMVRVVLQSRALHTDDTTVKMQELLTHQLSTARLWAYLGDAARPYNVFDFTLNRKRDGPQRFLASYQGYLHADAFSGYDGLYLPDPRTAAARIIEVACNAHARRKFCEARDSDALRAHQALAYYHQLYEWERGAKNFSDAQRLQMRQDLAVPISLCWGQPRTLAEANDLPNISVYERHIEADIRACPSGQPRGGCFGGCYASGRTNTGIPPRWLVALSTGAARIPAHGFAARQEVPGRSARSTEAVGKDADRDELLPAGRIQHRVELREDVVLGPLVPVAVEARCRLRGPGLVFPFSRPVGEREVGPPVRESVLVLHRGGKPGELLLEGAAEARLFLLLAAGRFQDEHRPLRERPGLPVRPVRRGVDVDVLVLQLLGVLLALVVPEA
jgi:hypothetical protein